MLFLKTPYRRFYFILFIVLWGFDGYPQLKLPGYTASLESHVSTGGQSPFWLISNRFGTGTLGPAMGITRVGMFTELDTTKRIDYNYGLEIANRFDGNNNFWFHQAYGEVNFYNLLEVRVGMKEETIGNEYTGLSTGSIIWSSNTRPIPVIDIRTPGYIAVPYTKGFVELKGSIAHGWFEQDRYVKRPYLHRKNMYARFGGTFPVNVEFGFNHMVMWGGEHPSIGKLPTDLDSFRRVFFALEGDPERDNTPGSWVINRFGNHLGSKNYGIEFKNGGSIFGAYHQDIFEDYSGLMSRNFPDGLWGLFYKSENPGRMISGIVYEYLQTSDQSGPLHDIGDRILGGDDNYFNHGTYQSGWTHHRMIIGTPFITSPMFNSGIDHPDNIKIWNNRVEAHHLGVKGNILSNMDYRVLVSYSKNMGVYASNMTLPEVFRMATPKYQWSWMMEFNYAFEARPLLVGLTLAGDKGEMYGDNLGIQLRVGYHLR